VASSIHSMFSEAGELIAQVADVVGRHGLAIGAQP
jgi:hypothetical protein